MSEWVEFGKILAQYGALGIIAYYYIRMTTKQSNTVADEYKKLIDNLIKTQNNTLKELSEAIRDLSNYIKNKNNFLVRLTNTTFWYIIHSEKENNKYCPPNVEHCMGQFYFIN